MTEHDLYGVLINGANSEGWQLFRLLDSQCGKQPGDIMGIAPDGTGVLIEVKLIKSRSGVTTNRLQRPLWFKYLRHQIAWLKAYARRGAYALCIEYDYHTKQMQVYVPSLPEHFVGNNDIPYTTLERKGTYPLSPWIGWASIIRLRKAQANVPSIDPIPWNESEPELPQMGIL